MSGIVHFKFKSSNAYDSVSFDGAFVSVGELKTLIAEKKGLSKDATSELQLSDPRTQAEYTDDSAVIPKSSSVLVRRVPSLQSGPAKYTGASQPGQPAGALPGPPAVQLGSTAPASGADDEFGGELYTEQKDEDAALSQMLAQTGQQWEKEVKAAAVRGRGRGFGRGGFGRGRGREPAPAILPKGYICYRCGQQGHHISDCPTSADPDAKRIRPAVGVPSVLLAKNAEGGLLLPDGTTGTLQPNEDAFLKEMGLAKPAEPPAAASEPPPASQPPPKLESEPAAAKPDDSKALVVASTAEPTLAGSSELPFGASGPILPLPGMGVPPWDAGMKLPGFPLPGLPDPKEPAPLSREEFQRMKEQLRRKARSRSRSSSRSRRDRRRDSRSPRRHCSARHRSSRDRSGSRDRRERTRRRSPSPSFIQLRKRSRSPRPRRQAGASRSPPPVVQLRKREPSSPRARSRRRDTTRYKPDEDAVQLQPRGEGRSKPSSSSVPAADFSVPQLMDDAPAFFDEPPLRDSRAPTRSRKPVDLGASLSRLQRGVGSRWKAEATEDKAKLAKAAANGGRAEASEEKAEEVHRSPSPDRGHSSRPFALAEEQQGHGPLPKTFSIPMGEPRKEKKEKRAKEKKSKRKRSKHSPERGSSQAVGATATDLDPEPREQALASGSPAVEELVSKKQRDSKSLFSKALAASVDQSSSGVPTTTGGTTTAGGSSDAAPTRLDSSAAQQGSEEEAKSDDQAREGKARKHKEHKHKHKHSKKKKHKEKDRD